MLARALTVLLIAINLGVAIWWLLRPEPVATPAAETAPGVPRLQLLSEAKPLAAPAKPIAATTVTQPPPPPPEPTESAPAQPNQCFSLGPFATPAALREAQARLPPAVRVRPRGGVAASSARGYTVVMPPLATRESAQATAERIKAAGFDDLLLINEGEDANGIALGRYGSLESAQRHQAALQAAGFAAQVRPIGASTQPSWLDIEARPGVDLARWRADTGATQSPALDCASLR